MDYSLLYRKYKIKYLNIANGGATTSLNTPISFTIKGERMPCVVVLDASDPRLLSSAHQIFSTLFGKSADEIGCTEDIPDPSPRLKRKYVCFGPKREVRQPGTVQMEQCNRSVDDGQVEEIIQDTTRLFEAYLTDQKIQITGSGHVTKVNGEIPFIEAHRYASHSECPVPRMPFTWHRDDYAATTFPTYTAIYYLYKSESSDVSFLGGSLQCAFPEDTVDLDNGTGSDITIEVHQNLDRSGKMYNIYTIPAKTGRIILMRGDVLHTPTELLETCHGCRDSVVVQIARSV